MISWRSTGRHAEIDWGWDVGEIHVHEFMSIDGVIDAPTWTFDYGFDPRMGEAIGAITQISRGILLRRTTYEMSSRGRSPPRHGGTPSWSGRTTRIRSGVVYLAYRPEA
jgi:hypothetical protein